MRAVLLLFLFLICPSLRATTVTGQIADAQMRAVSNATVKFQLLKIGNGASPARAITLSGIQSTFKARTRCDGRFNVKLVGNDAITTAKTLWQVRIIAPGFYLGPYNFSVTGDKLDLHIMGPRGTLDPKAEFYWGNDVPPFSYGLGCHVRKILDPFR